MSLPENFFPPPLDSASGLQYAAISIFGPEKYLIPTEDRALGFFCSRAFRTPEEARIYMQTAMKTRKVYAMMVVRLNVPLLLTQDPNNLNNAEYQERKLKEILKPFYEDPFNRLSNLNDLVFDEVANKTASADLPPPLEGEIVENKSETSTQKIETLETLQVDPVEFAKKLSKVKDDSNATIKSLLRDLLKEASNTSTSDTSPNTAAATSASVFFSKEDIMREIAPSVAKEESIENKSNINNPKKESVDFETILKETQKFTTKQTCYLAQFISIDKNGVPLPEPIIILRDFFRTKKQAANYTTEFFEKMRLRDENDPMSMMDLVFLEINKPVSAWYSRNIVKNFQEHPNEKLRREAEKKMGYNLSNVAKNLHPFLQKSSVLKRINKFENASEEEKKEISCEVVLKNVECKNDESKNVEIQDTKEVKEVKEGESHCDSDGDASFLSEVMSKINN